MRRMILAGLLALAACGTKAPAPTAPLRDPQAMITSAAFGMPLEIVGLVAAFYRFFDMGTTSMSVIGDLSATVLSRVSEEGSDGLVLSVLSFVGFGILYERCIFTKNSPRHVSRAI